MSPNASLAHYAILTAMLAPAFFLTATAALLTSANARLARIIDRARALLRDLAACDDPETRALLERRDDRAVLTQPIDELAQARSYQSPFAAVGLDKAISVQRHLGVQGNSAAKLLDPADVFRTDSLSVLNAPLQARKGGRFVHLLQGIKEGRDVFVVADVHSKRDSPPDQLAHILLDVLPHHFWINNDRGAVEILMIVHV